MIRGQKVLLDEDLALLYGVSVKRLNQQVRVANCDLKERPRRASQVRADGALLVDLRSVHYPATFAQWI